MAAYRFLLVSLSIETILGETTIHRRREKLKLISSGRDVGGVYNATLGRIKAQEKDRARLGMEAIMWIAYSERPLGPDELSQALGVEIGSRDLNSDNAPSLRTILNWTLGLLVADSSSSKVRLVHLTLQEHILANPTLFGAPHSIIAEVCLTYLNSKCIKDLSPALHPLPSITPFLEYASCYWGAHARRHASAGVISLALKLLDSFETHISCRLLVQAFEKEITLKVNYAVGFPGLHCAALLGISQILVPLLKIKKWDLNATDLFGNTVLVLAAGNGHDRIVKLLLEQEGINPDIADGWDNTPLSLAAAGGHEGVVKMLLERNDVNPEAVGHGCRTPLPRATERGCGRTVQMLLERNGVNPEAVAASSRPPLLRSSESWYEASVERLPELHVAHPYRRGRQEPGRYSRYSCPVVSCPRQPETMQKCRFE